VGRGTEGLWFAVRGLGFGAVDFGDGGVAFLEEELVSEEALLLLHEGLEAEVELDELSQGAAGDGEVIGGTRARVAGEHAGGVAEDAVFGRAVAVAHWGRVVRRVSSGGRAVGRYRGLWVPIVGLVVEFVVRELVDGGGELHGADFALESATVVFLGQTCAWIWFVVMPDNNRCFWSSEGV